jgi:Cobalamin-5-phosphate synthase
MPLDGLRLALTLLTAIPLPGARGGAAPSRRAAGAAMAWAPAVGLLLGGAAAAVLELATPSRRWRPAAGRCTSTGSRTPPTVSAAGGRPTRHWRS